MANLIDSYPDSNADTTGGINSANPTQRGQSFTGNGTAVGSVVFYLQKIGSPTGNATAYIYAHTGTFGSTGTPTGAALATSGTLDVSTLTAGSGSFAITLSFSGINQITVTNGTNYFVALEYTGGDASNNVQIDIDTISPTHGGNMANFSSPTWTALSGIDVIFLLYDNSGGIIPINFVKAPTMMVTR